MRNLKRGEPDPPPMYDVPSAPEHLGELARGEWERVCALMIDIGMLTELDLAGLALYADTYERWRAACAIMDSLAVDDPKTRGLIVRSKSGSVYENPVEALRRGLARDLARYAQQLGLSPSGRASICLESGGMRRRSADQGLADKYGI